MSTQRISWTSGSPSTEFQLYADRIGQSVSGNYTTVRIIIQAYNRGDTSSYSNYSGEHDGWITDYGNQGTSHTGNPFIPSGVANGARRWSEQVDVNVGHGSDGTRGAVTLNMVVKFDNGNYNITRTASFNDFPAINRSTVPPAPNVKDAFNIGTTTATIDIDSTGDGGATVDNDSLLLSFYSDFRTLTHDLSGQPAGDIFNVTGLVRNSTYYYKARLHNANGWGIWSSTKQFTTLPDYPGATTPNYIDGIAQTSFHYNFSGGDNGGADIQEWQVGYGTDPNNQTQNVMNPGGGDAYIYNLNRATTYYVWSRGRNSRGWGPWSSSKSATTLAYSSSPPQTNPIDNIQQLQFHESWSSPADNGGSAIQEYQVAWGTDPNTAQNYASAGLNGDITITGLAPGTVYYVWVRARNGNGWSDWGTKQSAQTISGARLRVVGVWRNVVPMVRVNGAWKIARPYRNVNGVWKPGV